MVSDPKDCRFSISCLSILLYNYHSPIVHPHPSLRVLSLRSNNSTLAIFAPIDTPAYEFIIGKALIMAHLFNKTEYYDYRTRVYSNIKKTLEAKVETLTEALHSQLHPMEGQEETVLDAAQVHILHEADTIVLPKKLLEVDLKDIVNLNNITEHFTQEEMQDLMALLPKQDLPTLK
jgi:uncharacterized protein YyaL (SSP411 family)